MDDLLETVRSQPDQWPGWLVLADWLTDQGDGRGQLISLEHRNATGTLSPREQRLLRQKRKALVKEHERKLLQECICLATADLVLDWQYGFVCGVRFLRVPDWRGTLEALLAHPSGRLLTVISLSGHKLGAEGAAWLAGFSPLSSLKTLYLGSNRLGSEGAAALAKPCFRSLTRLGLGSNSIEDEGAAALADSSALGSLVQLDLNRNTIRHEGASALIRSTALRSLVELDLEWNLLHESKGVLNYDAALRGRRLRL